MHTAHPPTRGVDEPRRGYDTYAYDDAVTDDWMTHGRRRAEATWPAGAIDGDIVGDISAFGSGVPTSSPTSLPTGRLTPKTGQHREEDNASGTSSPTGGSQVRGGAVDIDEFTGLSTHDRVVAEILDGTGSHTEGGSDIDDDTSSSSHLGALPLHSPHSSLSGGLAAAAGQGQQQQ